MNMARRFSVIIPNNTLYESTWGLETSYNEDQSNMSPTKK